MSGANRAHFCSNLSTSPVGVCRISTPFSSMRSLFRAEIRSIEYTNIHHDIDTVYYTTRNRYEILNITLNLCQIHPQLRFSMIFFNHGPLENPNETHSVIRRTFKHFRIKPRMYPGLIRWSRGPILSPPPKIKKIELNRINNVTWTLD